VRDDLKQLNQPPVARQFNLAHPPSLADTILTFSLAGSQAPTQCAVTHVPPNLLLPVLPPAFGLQQSFQLVGISFESTQHFPALASHGVCSPPPDGDTTPDRRCVILRLQLLALPHGNCQKSLAMSRPQQIDMLLREHADMLNALSHSLIPILMIRS
jgi:hypothetical protein